MIRVLFVSHYSTLYGANRSLLAILKHLPKTEVEATVLHPGGHELGSELDSLNLSQIKTPIPSNFRKFAPISVRLNPIALRRFRATKLQNLTRAMQAAYEQVQDSVAHGGFDLVYSNSAATRFGHFISSKLKLPHVWHLRENPVSFNWDFISTKGEFLNQLRGTSKIVAISNAIKNYYCPSADLESKTSVVLNGVISQKDFLRFAIPKVPPKTNWRLLLLGAIAKGKGYPQAIQAMKLLVDRYGIKNCKLQIVGDGETTEAKQLADNYRINAYVDVLPRTNYPLDTIRDSDVLLMCSSYEGMGRVTAEAMAVGTPVIGFDAAGTGEILSHRKTGLLYRRTSYDLARQIRLLITSPVIYERLSQNAREFARTNFIEESYSSRITQIIRHSLNCTGNV